MTNKSKQLFSIITFPVQLIGIAALALIPLATIQIFLQGIKLSFTITIDSTNSLKNFIIREIYDSEIIGNENQDTQ